jgi:sulfur carrier protein ThiS
MGVRVTFTSNLERHVTCPARDVDANTVAQALGVALEDNPRAKSYVLDDQGRLRKHVVVFVNGRQISDRERLSDVLEPGDQVFVMQALSGG